MQDSDGARAGDTPILPRAMLFDMDGTLTVPYFDFDAIRREVGVGNSRSSRPSRKWTTRDAAGLWKFSIATRMKCAARCVLNPGSEELIEWLKSHNVRLAVVTRNSFSAARCSPRLKIPIEVLITRDDGVFQTRASSLCFWPVVDWTFSPADTWMIGDGQYDIEAGHAAKIRTIWLHHGQPGTFEAMPDVELRDLTSSCTRCSDNTRRRMSDDRKG